MKKIEMNSKENYIRKEKKKSVIFYSFLSFSIQFEATRQGLRDDDRKHDHSRQIIGPLDGPSY